MAAIAQRASTSQSQLLKHFTDKDGLLHEILSEGWQELNSAIRLATTRIPVPAEQLKLIVDMLLAYVRSNAAFGRLFLFESDRVSRTDPVTREFAQTLESVFEWMMGLRELKPGISPRALRVGLMGALKAMLVELMVNPHDAQQFSETEVRILISNFLSSCTRPRYEEGSVAMTLDQTDEQPWVNHYLELAEMVLRSSKPGRA